MVVGNQALFSLSFWLLSRKLNKGFFANVTARKPSLIFWKLKFPKIRIFAKNTSGKLLRTKAKMYVFSIHAIAILCRSRNVRYVIYDASISQFAFCLPLGILILAKKPTKVVKIGQGRIFGGRISFRKPFKNHMVFHLVSIDAATLNLITHLS